MQSMRDYVRGRTSGRSMVDGMPGDWGFVDWADGFLDKKGELAYEQGAAILKLNQSTYRSITQQAGFAHVDFIAFIYKVRF